MTIAISRPSAPSLHPGRVALHLVLMVAGLFVLLPFLLMLVGSLMPKADILKRSIDVARVSLNNYFEAFQVVPFGRY
jgi:ABC-type glycerol-3-phosphate transport system permease component